METKEKQAKKQGVTGLVRNGVYRTTTGKAVHQTYKEKGKVSPVHEDIQQYMKTTTTPHIK